MMVVCKRSVLFLWADSIPLRCRWCCICEAPCQPPRRKFTSRTRPRTLHIHVRISMNPSVREGDRQVVPGHAAASLELARVVCRQRRHLRNLFQQWIPDATIRVLPARNEICRVFRSRCPAVWRVVGNLTNLLTDERTRVTHGIQIRSVTLNEHPTPRSPLQVTGRRSSCAAL